MLQPPIRLCALVLAASSITFFATAVTAQATDKPQSRPQSQPQSRPQSQPQSKAGDPLKVEFTLPFKKALARAKAEKRLIFLKPIYGGVDRAGAKDYRCGSW